MLPAPYGNIVTFQLISGSSQSTKANQSLVSNFVTAVLRSSGAC